MADVSLAIRLQVDPGVGATAVEMNPEETTTGGLALVSSRIRIGSDINKITSHRIAPKVEQPVSRRGSSAVAVRANVSTY